MAEKSEPLLRIIRDLIARRKLNTASLAATTGLDRSHLRKILSGTEPMTVDELLSLGEALQLDPSDLGIPVDLLELPSDEPDSSSTPSDAHSIDPWGNHPEQLVRTGFDLGCDFMLVTDTEQLEGSGIPKHVLEAYAGKELPIKLDATYHHYNEPVFDEGGLTLTLSFDSLYTCRFPWTAITQVLFFPLSPEPPEEEKEEEAPKGPILRLVT